MDLTDMEPKWKQNKKWADKFTPLIKKIVGPLLLVETELKKEDAFEATDLFVLKLRDMRIACRVRRYGFAEKYPDQFTIRSKLSSNIKTELSKILIDGWGDWMFYGHSNVDESDIPTWWIIDLTALRGHMIRNNYNGKLKIDKDISNGDGTFFWAFHINSFPVEPLLVIASKRQRNMKGEFV